MSRDMAAMTVADESLYALPLQRLNVFAASRDRQRRMPSDRGAVPSYFAATSTSGLSAAILDFRLPVVSGSISTY